MPQKPDTHDPHSVRGPHGLQNLPQVELEIIRGAARQRKRRVTGPAFLIGRAHDSDLVLGDPQFPEAHSYILLDSHGVTIRHMGDDPPLLVNDEQVSTRALRDGDTISTGRYEFLVRISPPPYRGRPFGESDQIDLELNAGDGDDAPGGVAMLIAFAESPNADMAPPGEKLGGSLRLPHWLRPPLPCFAAGDAKRAAAKSLTVSAHTRALATGGQRSLAPKRAI